MTVRALISVVVSHCRCDAGERRSGAFGRLAALSESLIARHATDHAHEEQELSGMVGRAAC
jgi:hypothetical protein